MALRNFWAEVEVDGRETAMAGGPRSKDGGLMIRLYQRNDGEKINPVTVNCWAKDGRLYTAVTINGERFVFDTKR